MLLVQTSQTMHSCVRYRMNACFAELGWCCWCCNCLSCQICWVLFLNWRTSKHSEDVKGSSQKRISKIYKQQIIHFVCTCEDCTYSAFKFVICDHPHRQNLIKGSEEGKSIKLSAGILSSVLPEPGSDFWKCMSVPPSTSLSLRSDLSGIQTLEISQLNSNNLPSGNSTNLLFT